MVVTAADQDSGFVPPKPPPRWWLRTGLAVVVAAALVAGGLWARQHFLIRCGDGVRTQGPYDECIGVTDGAYVFDSHLKDVIGRIHAENQAVDPKKDWVAVAYVEPMTRGPGDKGWNSIREELQGAYLAQRELNAESGGHGTRPQIKLLLANPGRGLRQQKALVRQLLDMTDGPHPVVAVAGFGQSRLSTRSAVTTLRRHGVPMVGSTVTADRLSAADPAGFFRAVPPNSAEATAVVKHLARQQKTHHGFRVQLIRDRNDDDIYSRSLATGFTRAARRAGLEPDPETVPFLSGDKRGVDNAMASVADKICDQQEPPDAVYFAGRGRDLRRFVESSGANGRHCPVTVFTGDDAVGMFFDIDPEAHPEEYAHFLEQWKQSGVRVKYTALAHPDAAEDIYPTGANPYPAFAEAYADAGFGGEKGLLNGQAMLGHDAVVAVGEAIRSAAGEQGTDPVSTGTVLGMLLQINGRDAFAGVSGPIDFDETGNPAHKPMPLVELHPRSRNAYEYLGLVRP